VLAHKPERHREALSRQRATLSSCRAPEMNAGQDRPGPPACTAASAKDPSSDTVGTPNHPKGSTDTGTKGRAVENWR
jgi:hypothetical protein